MTWIPKGSLHNFDISWLTVYFHYSVAEVLLVLRFLLFFCQTEIITYLETSLAWKKKVLIPSVLYSKSFFLLWLFYGKQTFCAQNTKRLAQWLMLLPREYSSSTLVYVLRWHLIHSIGKILEVILKIFRGFSYVSLGF